MLNSILFYRDRFDRLVSVVHFSHSQLIEFVLQTSCVLSKVFMWLLDCSYVDSIDFIPDKGIRIFSVLGKLSVEVSHVSSYLKGGLTAGFKDSTEIEQLIVCQSFQVEKIDLSRSILKLLFHIINPRLQFLQILVRKGLCDRMH